MDDSSLIESARSAPPPPPRSRFADLALRLLLPFATSSSAAHGAGNADGLAAADDDEAVGEARLARFAHLARRWFRASKNLSPETRQTPALTAGRIQSPTLNLLNADTFAAAAAQFAGEVAGSHLDDQAKNLAAAAILFAASMRSTLGSADGLVRTADDLWKAATGTPFAVQASDLLVSVSCLVVIPEETRVERLARSSHEFVTAAKGSSMEDAARRFAEAVDAFAAGEFRSMKAGDTDLCRMGQMLEHIASIAPNTEKNLAETAAAIVGESSILLLDDAPRRLSFTAKWVDPISCLRSLRDCFSAAHTAAPVLPLHRYEVKRQAKLADQRTFIFGLTLSNAVALLTTMKVESVVSTKVAAWVGAGSAIVWLCVNGGSVMNLFGQSTFEQRAAEHLSRLGMMGLSVLFCLYMHASFFPGIMWLFWALLAMAIALHGTIWLLGCFRHDDDSSFRLSGEDLCMCPRCKPSCACCSKSGPVVLVDESV